MNAGGAFSLIRFQTEDGSEYWLKATGTPNTHEYPVTVCLCGLLGPTYPQYLPMLIATRPGWNAWLMSGNATNLTDVPTDSIELRRSLEDAVESMAELQMRTAGHRPELLKAGAFDQGLQVFQTRSEALFDYLVEAMSVQTSTRVPRLERSRILEIRSIFEDVCRRIEDLGLPETILHGDLNYGNILTGSGHCQFIDWSEAYVGNPLIALQHLLLLNKALNLEVRHRTNRALKQRYRDTWSKVSNPAPFERGFAYMPLLAIASCLLGRGNWLTAPERKDPRRQAYARTLARYMDRATRDPELLEALCR